MHRRDHFTWNLDDEGGPAGFDHSGRPRDVGGARRERVRPRKRGSPRLDPANRSTMPHDRSAGSGGTAGDRVGSTIRRVHGAVGRGVPSFLRRARSPHCEIPGRDVTEARADGGDRRVDICEGMLCMAFSPTSCPTWREEPIVISSRSLRRRASCGVPISREMTTPRVTSICALGAPHGIGFGACRCRRISGAAYSLKMW
jgi:hypothetical protein